MFFFLLQYGRANIEQSRNSKRLDDSDEDDEGYSEEICPQDKSQPELLDKCDLDLPNGLKKPKNGYRQQNGNGNALISRDDNLILVPEPPTQQKPETDEAKGSDDENNSVWENGNFFWLVN